MYLRCNIDYWVTTRTARRYDDKFDAGRRSVTEAPEGSLVQHVRTSPLSGTVTAAWWRHKPALEIGSVQSPRGGTLSRLRRGKVVPNLEALRETHKSAASVPASSSSCTIFTSILVVLYIYYGPAPPPIGPVPCLTLSREWKGVAS